MVALGVGSAVAHPADYLAEGHEAFMKYDFQLAAELYAKYAKTLKTRPDEEGEKLLEKLERQLEIAENSLDNIQKIEIIDRIDVPAGDFITNIALPPSAGSFLDKNMVPLKERVNDSDFVFSSSSGDTRLWTEIDKAGKTHILESTRLIDGSWEHPQSSGDILNDGGNVRNPFMLTDGVTLYFSGDGDGSMGGYDLFVASKDPDTGNYRQPIGLGYPFNSPFNEYMMAVDEENGIGWWVTDRNQIDGKLSVYVFFNNDVRKNYRPDEEEDMTALAKLEDITLAQTPGKDYSKVISAINSRHTADTSNEESEILFLLPGGKAIRNTSDLKSAGAKRNLPQYISAEHEFSANESKLRELRKKYHLASNGKGASQALKNQITDLEKKIDWQRDKLKKMRNGIISAELEATGRR